MMENTPDALIYWEITFNVSSAQQVISSFWNSGEAYFDKKGSNFLTKGKAATKFPWFEFCSFSWDPLNKRPYLARKRVISTIRWRYAFWSDKSFSFPFVSNETRLPLFFVASYDNQEEEQVKCSVVLLCLRNESSAFFQFVNPPALTNASLCFLKVFVPKWRHEKQSAPSCSMEYSSHGNS